MPKWLKEFIGNLSNEQAEELWKYLDGEGDQAVDQMIALTVDSHPKVLELNNERSNRS